MSEKELQNNEITQFSKGLYLDNSNIDTPKGTYKFTLNSVNETELGDSGFISNEESNYLITTITPGYIPLGKVYIGLNKTCIFSVSGDNTISEIGVLKDGVYTVHVNDVDSLPKNKLGFKKEHQIQATYRLRKGCEDTIYFVAKNIKPKYFNFNKPNQFKSGGNWDGIKFNLFRTLGTFPTINSVEVLNSSGKLKPGSYTIVVQHLDEDLNGTEFYELVKDINIYNDSLETTFSDIEGSSNIGQAGEPYKYDATSKAIKISLDNVDKDFSYVRFGFIERTSGNGQISDVKYSDLIGVNNPVFLYTGENASTTGTIEEVSLFNANSGLNSAEHIDQIDNMLILAKVQGDQTDMCLLQQYASKIKTDCFVKDTILTTIKEAHNPKNPLVSYNGVGYQPGDIYSLGIQYLFEDYSVSPVMHIPGKSSQVANNLVYSPEMGVVYPMTNNNNQNISERYLDENTSCPSKDYWGVDSEGNKLKNTPVRHHRFPTRDEVNVDFVTRIETTGNITNFKKIILNILGNVKKTTESYTAVNFLVKVKYFRNGIEESFVDGIYPDSNIPITSVESNIFQGTDTITDIRLYTIEEGSTTEVLIPLLNNASAEQANGLTYNITVGIQTENSMNSIYKVPIFGLKFSNIELPSEDILGKKVIGYQIVRQERTESDKNILDSGVVFPMLKSGRNVSTGLLAPEYFTHVGGGYTTCEGSEDPTIPTCYNVSKKNLMILTPGHKFMDKTYDGYTNIVQVGNFENEYVAKSATSHQNVYEGSSANEDTDNKTDDDDGYSLRHGYRFTGVKYKKTVGAPLSISGSTSRTYNLNALNYADSENGAETLYNLSCDNKALVVSSSDASADLRTYRPGKHNFPYVYIRKDNSSFYQNFRSEPYYLASTEVFTNNTCKVFGGDTLVTPLRHSTHVFGNAIAALRRKKISGWALVGALVTVLIGAFLIVISGGLGAAATYVLAGGILTALGGIVTGTAALIEVAKFTEIYGDKWQANLDKTVFDFMYARLFIREYPEELLDSDEPDPHYLSWSDDTFRWWGEVVGDLWFESTLNMSLRVSPNNMENNYLKPLKPYMNDRTFQFYDCSQAEYVSNNRPGGGRFHRYIDPELGVTDFEEWYFYSKIMASDNNSSNKKYTGVSIPQIFLINPDHYVTTGIKRFYTIPIEYDCCSDCREDFPHRVHYSLQSFQEEKSDNYRLFLPNNYRDIEGETGSITNIFRFYNNLFIHTEEALWKMGRKYQERVTNDIVSFIGTGSYFEVPPDKIIDDDTGNSAGTQHKWSGIKTPNGYFFISGNQKKIYQFDGNKLIPISSIGLSNWFKNNLDIENNLFPDNPSNPNGSGFISTYDSQKERVIFTKKDFILNKNFIPKNSEVCYGENGITVFENLPETIADYVALGWTFMNIENCKLKFSKKTTTTTIDVNVTQVWHEPVYEEVIDTSVGWVVQICFDVYCADGGSGLCYGSFSIEDIDGVLHTQTYSMPNYSNMTVCLGVDAWVPLPVTPFIDSDTRDPGTVEFDETRIKTIKTLVSEGYYEEVTVETPITTIVEEFTYVDGILYPIEDLIESDNSWTMSFSLKNNTWVSWHSYLPNFYFNIPEKFYSWKVGNNGLWEHNVKGEYQYFYGTNYPHILEYVSLSTPLTTRDWNTLRLQTEAKEYFSDLDEYVDDKYTTFNKVVLYNSRQCSGVIDLVVKDTILYDENYLANQVSNNQSLNKSIIDKTEGDWFINDFRDLRVDYSKPIWNSSKEALKNLPYIDKVLNTSTIDLDKDWTQLESFRDKYLVVRLIFDNFANKKLITNYTVENEQPSLH